MVSNAPGSKKVVEAVSWGWGLPGVTGGGGGAVRVCEGQIERRFRKGLVAPGTGFVIIAQ